MCENYTPSILNIKSTAQLDEEVQQELNLDTPDINIAKAMLENDEEENEEKKHD